MFSKYTWIGLCVVLCLMSACADEETVDGKGAEDDALTSLEDGKLDSFRKPTEQGELFPGDRASATIESDRVFHAWTFTLESSATLILRTDVSQNLDTVMYLYRRDPGTTRWGRYIAKNDDHRKNIWSQITQEDAPAGEYRVIVKPFKSSLRGDFSLNFECAGVGCPARTQVMCAQRSFATNSGDVTQGCIDTLGTILSTPVLSNGRVPECIQARARELYVSYWDSLVGWEDIADGESPEDVINIDGRVHGDAGYVLQLDIGGDEDSLVYIFNAEGQVLLFVHDEQSPIQEWSCGDERDEEISSESQPDESCSLRMLYDMDLDPSTLKVSDNTSVDQVNDDVPLIVRTTIDYAVESMGVSDSEVVQYEVYNTFQDKAFTARVVFGDPMEPESMAIYASQSFSDSVDIIYTTGGEMNQSTMICDEHKLQN